VKKRQYGIIVNVNLPKTDRGVPVYVDWYPARSDAEAALACCSAKWPRADVRLVWSEQ
jgi:hypothetical protein